MAYAIRRTVPAGSTAEVLAVRDEQGELWYEVRVAKDTGWMSSVVLDVDPTLAAALPINAEAFAPPPTATPKPKPKPAPDSASCDPAYPGVCIPPYPPDLDCGEISYRRFRVLAPDPHGSDRDNDGIGCES